jgi:hypothetical protein
MQGIISPRARRMTRGRARLLFASSRSVMGVQENSGNCAVCAAPVYGVRSVFTTRYHHVWQPLWLSGALHRLVELEVNSLAHAELQSSRDSAVPAYSADRTPYTMSK